MKYEKVSCNFCEKEFDVTLRVFNYYNKAKSNFYCNKECRDNKKLTGKYVKCANCGDEFYKQKSQISNANDFCSHSCSASFNNKKRIVSEEQKNKVRNSLINKGIEKRIIEDRYKECIVCKNEFKVIHLGKYYSRTNTCSEICSFKLKSESSKRNMRKVIEDNNHKGWITRNLISFPEGFFMKVLKNNNIKYEHNFKVKQKDLGLDNNYCYFLDFYLKDKNIDLEIDGRQHVSRLDHDKERDINISKKYIVYRIKWNDIKYEKGKIEMKEKIDNFINFYNSI